LIRYEPAPDVCGAVRVIAGGLPAFRHVRVERVGCVASWGSRSRSVARIHGVSRAWLLGLGVEPGYVIEVIGERFYGLPPRERVAVLIHELLHIPASFSGGLRPHGRLVNEGRVRRLLRELEARGLLAEAVRAAGWDGPG